MLTASTVSTCSSGGRPRALMDRCANGEGTAFARAHSVFDGMHAPVRAAFASRRARSSPTGPLACRPRSHAVLLAVARLARAILGGPINAIAHSRSHASPSSGRSQTRVLDLVAHLSSGNSSRDVQEAVSGQIPCRRAKRVVLMATGSVRHLGLRLERCLLGFRRERRRTRSSRPRRVPEHFVDLGCGRRHHYRR